MIGLRLDARIAALATLSPAQLRDEWVQQHGEAAPSLSADLLRLGLAYRMQEQALGGLDAATRRVLDGQRVQPTLAAGTRLLRSWQGRTVSVTVTDTGFDHDGREWPSLTAIATSVTGTQYSGPRFFGIGRYAAG